MNLTILGATGATGTILVERALAAGHHVTALARNPQKLTTTHPNLRAIAGDATDGAAVARALEGADAVISALGATKGALMADATRAIVAGAERHGVKRVVVLSSFAVQRERLGGVAKLMTGLMMGAMIKDRPPARTSSAPAGSTGRSSTPPCWAAAPPRARPSCRTARRWACRRRSPAPTWRRSSSTRPRATGTAAPASPSPAASDHGRPRQSPAIPRVMRRA